MAKKKQPFGAVFLLPGQNKSVTDKSITFCQGRVEAVKHLANIITTSRIAASALLLFTKAFSPWFYVLYIYCGASDMIDGTVARRTNSQSAFGEKLDSVSDVCFFAASAVKIFPFIIGERLILIFACAILALKMISITCGAVKFKKLVMPHTVMNKVTGFLLFVLPLTFRFADIKLVAVPVCVFAAVSAAHEFYCVLTGRGTD